MIVGIREVAPELFVEVRELLLQLAVSVCLLFVLLDYCVVVGLEFGYLLGLLLDLEQEVFV